MGNTSLRMPLLGLGAALVGKREQLIISTKVGRLLVPTRSTEAVRHGFVMLPG